MSRRQSRSHHSLDDGKAKRKQGNRLVVLAPPIIVVAIVSAYVYSRGNVPTAQRWQTSRAPHSQPVPVGSGVQLDNVRLPFGVPEQWKQLDDPLADGWDTEDLAAKCGEQLKKIATFLNKPTDFSDEQLATLVTDEFECSKLTPRNRRKTFQDGTFEVYRMEEDPNTDSAGSVSTFRAAAGFKQALAQLKESLGDDEVRFETKIVRVEREGNSATTRQYIEISNRAVEQHATWLIQWTLPSGSSRPKFRSIAVLDWIQVTAQDGPLFADCTEAVLGGNACFHDQFLHGMNHWFERIQETQYNALLSTPGLVVGDVNADGWDDLYVCQEAGLPNRLFLQQSDGTATEVAAQWGVDWLDECRSALLLDLDNDGDQDLVAATVGNLIVASNEGVAFKIRAALPTDHDTMSLAAADYDNDGKLDIFVCVNDANRSSDERRHNSASRVLSTVYYDSTTGGRNSLFHNEIPADGDWVFRDVTGALGIDADNHRVSYAAAWEDYNNDGRQDLYVANDFGPNNLWRNELSTDGQTRFTDTAVEAGAEDRASGMSAAWGDVNRDGEMDLYVGNMFSSAGERITHQPEFKSGAPDVKSSIQRFARGNTLLRNARDGRFDDVSEVADVTVGRWSWSSNFVDLNNDGWEDLVVANGYITTEDTGDL